MSKPGSRFRYESEVVICNGLVPSDYPPTSFCVSRFERRQGSYGPGTAEEKRRQIYQRSKTGSGQCESRQSGIRSGWAVVNVATPPEYTVLSLLLVVNSIIRYGFRIPTLFRVHSLRAQS